MMLEKERPQLMNDAHPASEATPGIERSRRLLRVYGPLGLLLVIALLRGFAYANLMPPWAIIDEEQHLHYVQVLSEDGRRPDPRGEYLSEDLIVSLFETQRWATYGFAAPPSMDPRDMGLEGYSYEGYQPPLYYLLMLPFYRLARGSMLEKLYVLRWATVALSSLTILITYSMIKKLNGSKQLAFIAAIILLSIPERTVAVGRVNNDALLEILGALYLWLCLRAIIETPKDRDSVLLGIILGLGTLTKMTMIPLVIALPIVFYPARATYSLRRGLCLSLGGAAFLILPLIAYNLRLFGDVTGFSAVAPILNFPAPVFSITAFLDSCVRLFIYFWVILWQSAQAAINPTFTLLYGILFLISCLSVLGLRQALRTNPENEGDRRRVISIWLLVTTVGTYACFTLYSYWLGQVPVIQGRFLLPVSAAIAALLVNGLKRAPAPAISLLALILALQLMDGLVLFNHLLPQYYLHDPSTVAGQSLSSDFISPIKIYLQRLGAYKPGIVQQLLGATITGYILAQVLALLGGVLAIRNLLKPEATQNH